ncbi:molybdate transport repressor ModE-like protein [Streptacidiphilus sp. BW17]|uniref:LysR family transcriptional regulator n=1 Tax=Streptacidiphilus sp. BW17 TaxID=3156274 RepID=UPI0035148D52
MFELRHFEVLRAIAREGSLAAAGRALGFSQPTITHHLTAMESQAGTTLVRRGARGAALTPAGDLLLAHGAAVLERVRLAEHELRALLERGVTALRIGTFPTAGALLLPPAVKHLHRLGIEVSLTEGELPLLVDELHARRLDAALVFSQPGEGLDLGGSFEVHPLLDDPLQLVLPADHPLAAQHTVPITTLREEGWIMGHSDWDPVDRVLTWVCAKADFEPVRVMRTDDYAVLQGFVAAGVGIALLPRLGIAANRTDLAVRPIDIPGKADGLTPARKISLAVPLDTPNPGTEQLLRALQVQAQRLLKAWELPRTSAS